MRESEREREERERERETDRERQKEREALTGVMPFCVGIFQITCLNELKGTI